MKVLHITAHLGGGVGKAHASVAAASNPSIQRHYALLENPRDRRFADQIAATGATVSHTATTEQLVGLIEDADIVQIEWWNHPRLYGALCALPLVPMRTIFWCHISGLFAPFIPQALLPAGHRFLFTSACSLEDKAVAGLPATVAARLGVVNSGFGFADPVEEPAAQQYPDRIATLGTLDFVKMSPLFFDAVDAIATEIAPVALWGAVDPDGAVPKAQAAMQRPGRIRFAGHAADPRAVLAEAGIFLYLLQPQHFGTAENALIEAMSLGSVPVTFDNPAERAIIRHGETGFLERDPAAVARRIETLLADPALLARVAKAAMADVAATRTPQLSADRLAQAYADVLGEEKRTIDFQALLGRTPAQWFLGTQDRDPVPEAEIASRLRAFAGAGQEAKGSLAHFRAAFPDDPQLAG